MLTLSLPDNNLNLICSSKSQEKYNAFNDTHKQAKYPAYGGQGNDTEEEHLIRAPDTTPTCCGTPCWFGIIDTDCLDDCARMVFPVCFFAFNIIYWTYYLYLMEPAESWTAAMFSAQSTEMFDQFEDAGTSLFDLWLSSRLCEFKDYDTEKATQDIVTYYRSIWTYGLLSPPLVCTNCCPVWRYHGIITFRSVFARPKSSKGLSRAHPATWTIDEIRLQRLWPVPQWSQ